MKTYALLAVFLFSVCAARAAHAGDEGGSIVFSKAPIDASSPADLTSEFHAGDHIYALMRFPKPVKEFYPRKAQIMLQMEVDAGTVFYQYVTFKDSAVLDLDHIVLDIAPDPVKMTTYRDKRYVWGEGQKNLKLGPDAFTYYLGQMKPGKHTVVIRDYDFGTSKAVGTFTIEGDDYSSYSTLHEEVEKAMKAAGSFPEAAMQDDALVAKIRALAENAGWKNVKAIHIVDKDWWIDRVAGGDSAVKSRHLDAAIGATDDKGTFYRICRFQEPALLTGGFGELELTTTGERRELPAAALPH